MYRFDDDGKEIDVVRTTNYFKAGNLAKNSL
jgi:hypothetical protein